MKLLSRLNPRERMLVLTGGAVLLIYGLWTFVWLPTVSERALQTDRIARYLAVTQIALTADDAVPVAVRSPNAAIPLAPRITVAKAGYNDLIEWIAALEATQNVRVVSVEMSRATEPGQVSLRLLLEDAG
jgi:type II secretory pathway component PulM